MKFHLDKPYLLRQFVLILVLIAIFVVIPIAFFSENSTPYLDSPLNFVILVAVIIATSIAIAFARGAIKISAKRDDKTS